MAKSFTIGLIQHQVESSVSAQHRKTIEAIRVAKSKGAQVVGLQELFATPYFCKAELSENFSLAVELGDESLVQYERIAKELDIVLVLPFFEKRGPGVYHNSVTVIDADGKNLGLYRKMHIPDDPLYYEKFYFTPGDATGESSGYRIFKTKYADIGVLICWDQWYPEAARITAMLGAEVLFYPTAIGWHPAEKAHVGNAQHSAWQTMQRAHAIANGVYVAAINRVGLEAFPGTDGIEFFGGSFVSDPSGQIVAEAAHDTEAILIAQCERRAIEETRQNWPFFRDRRIDSYAPILSRYLK